MAQLVAIAEAVVTALNAHSFSQPVAAVRTYLPRIDLETADALAVQVAPKPTKALAIGSADRSHDQFDYQIYIGVQRRFEKPTRDDLDGMVGLVEELATFWRKRRPQNFTAICHRVEIDPLFAPEHLDEKHQFTALITLHFRDLR